MNLFRHAIALLMLVVAISFGGRSWGGPPVAMNLWVLKLPSIFNTSLSTPAIADDGTIYLGSRNREFYAVTPEGKLKWVFPTGGWVDSSPAIAADGTFYFGSHDKTFYALNPHGSEKWEFRVGALGDSSPAIAAGGTIF